MIDGPISQAHHYFTFERGEEEVTFAIPRQVQVSVALSACKSLMPGWRWIDRIDPTYGQGATEEQVQRWREAFLKQLAGTHFTREYVLSLVDLDETETKAA